MLLDEALHGGDKGARHRLHGVGGSHFGSSLLPDEVHRTFDDLQPRDDCVQIHPVDGFGLQNHMLAQHVGHRLW
jgi:hypothetical protein